MTEVVPENGMILAEELPAKPADQGGILYEKEVFPQYRVLSAAAGVEWPRPGDVVVCASTGTKLCLQDRTLYLFDPKNVAGTVVS